jgi:(2Fe-2S) ferredoxin
MDKSTSHPLTAVILLSRGGYGDAPQRQLSQLVRIVQATSSYPLVEGAFVDLETPSLPKALQNCATAGAQRILVQPIFIPGDDNLQRWLVKLILRWRKNWTGPAVEVIFGDSLGDYPVLGEVIAQACTATAEYGQDVGRNTPTNWQKDPSDWSVIPPHRYHVLFCRGPRCTAVGAGELSAYLAQKLKEANLNDKPHGVLMVETGCQYPCNLGPVMIVYPDGIWYSGLTPAAIDQIVEKHFCEGQVVAEYARYPGAQAQKRPASIQD